MAHKVYISFKKEDEDYKIYIQRNLDVDMIDKSLNERIDSEDEDYIMRRIREDYLSDSTVTIFLIGLHSSEDEGKEEQVYIKRELQASLYNGSGNTRNGILGVVLPGMENKIYKDPYTCVVCGRTHNCVNINDNTTIKEFSKNYYIESTAEEKCCWSEEERYCVLVRWRDFVKDAERYINQAYSKRADPIAQKVKVYPK